jgi:hypothetical protein
MIKTLQEFLDPKHLVQNTYLFSVLSIFLAMYGPRLQPKLPASVRTVFNNDLFRAVVIFLIVYLASKNIHISLVLCVIFLVTMNLVHMDGVTDLINSEGFVINGPPLNSDSYNKKSIDLIGTVFYPLNDNDTLRENRTDEDLPKFGGEVKY